ncbi:uncharacterized protein LOC123008968 [Tribolium madens]|uniref:uncharacterized protein LOC123008968 n=1 Tax=Tribolium madens TaxID=41895 RepID=UPI001CF75B25|nr:uncharacterized protein LOC123008968 [Tribolium madens]
MVLDAFLQEPTTSIRTISRLYGESKSLVQRVLKENHQHPYHYTQVQYLQPQDYPARVEFCQWLLRQHADNPNFLDRVIFTVESCFTRDGVFSSRNYHVWAGENPNATRPRAFQHRFSINLWAGILGDRIIGPVELPRILNAENYAKLLLHNLEDLLDNVPLQHLPQWFQHDSAPAHFPRNVRDILHHMYPNQWKDEEVLFIGSLASEISGLKAS